MQMTPKEWANHCKQLANADREVMSMLQTVIDDANMDGYELHLIDSHSDMALYITQTYPNCPPTKAYHVVNELITWADNKRSYPSDCSGKEKCEQ